MSRSIALVIDLLELTEEAGGLVPFFLCFEGLGPVLPKANDEAGQALPLISREKRNRIYKVEDMDEWVRLKP